MAENKGQPDELVEITRTLLIVQLLLAGVPQRNIREIASCDMNKVSAIAKLVGKQSKQD